MIFVILTGNEIRKQVLEGRIHISPFDLNRINPNSYNFRLGGTIKIYSVDDILDPKEDNRYYTVTLGDNGFVINPGELYIGHTVEEIGSDYYVPLMVARSSVGRLGISIFLNSGLGDIGFKQQWTLEITAVRRVRLYPGMGIGQMLFIKPEGDITLYAGRYNDSEGPVTCKLHEDFSK